MPEFAPFQLDSERKHGSSRYWSRRNEQAVLRPGSTTQVYGWSSDGTPTARALVVGDLPYVSREIPITTSAQTISSGVPTAADETATDIFTVFFSTPATWDGVTAITLTTFWFSTATGLKDIETEIISMTEVDENTAATIQAFTNSNLTWAAANTIKTLTTTITPTAGLHYRVRFRCNTGDASTGTLFWQHPHARTAWR